jgi:uncharacterized OB-fold protein
MSATDRDRLPSPGWSDKTEGYWLAAGKGRLAVQRCGNCGAHRWPAVPVCYACNSLEWSWDEVAGTGTVFTYTWVDESPHGAMAQLGAYNISVIDLDGVQGETVRYMGRVVDADKQRLQCGLRVAVDFEPFDDEVAIPVFRVAEGADQA